MNQIQPKPRIRISQSQEARGKKSQTRNQVRARSKDPKRRRKSQLRSHSQTTRHTTNPPDSCLGRSFLIGNVSKGRGRPAVASTAPPGGRFWHGFAVRRPPVGRGGRGLTFGLPLAKEIGRYPAQSLLAFDNRGMERKSAPKPSFFTERTLATHLAVSDRTIRNWIRRGDLPSYKLGASRRIAPADVENFLARHRDEAA